MTTFESRINPHSDVFVANRTHMLRMLADVRELEQRTRDRSARSRPLFDKRAQLLPRDRIALLLDPGSAWLELSQLAGFTLDNPDPTKAIAGAGVITGLGVVAGTRCVVVASDAGIEAGSIRAMGREKMLRAQEIALENKLPFVFLVESAGANLLQYKVDGFVLGGAIFRNLARLSAAGLPVVTIVHGSSTAGGAYMPGLSDYVIMVRGRARAFLAGPPLLKAATGEIATEEELGGAEMHTSVSGLGEYMAEDDADGVRLAREVVQRLQWSRHLAPAAPAQDHGGLPPRLDPEELLGIMSADGRKPADMREVITRLVDDSDFMEFKSLYGSATVTGHATIQGYPVGIITNNGPLDPDGANKATHFIQACCQSGTALIYLQNTTGYMVGTAYERAGMIKHGSKMIQAVTNATVPQFTVMCGSSFGAGNYGMCGRAYEPRFLFSWPNARTAVMGGEQAATTMRIVAEAGARRKGIAIDEAAMAAQEKKIVDNFESQQSAIATSSLMLDDGVIDPRDTRAVLGLCLTLCDEAARRVLRPMQFGVARP
ncbi:MAG: acyl-CoA carboxylase subunit beta [Rhodoferax sp.]|nr:acyl-CoA carboxylase subunit beta [Rhodoferax sp.]HQX58963.1 carboxyl transferase domain-containing protein [Burkholderiaceae bacterium]HQZ05785.1 carboxyl transferase domain-containing protein [Burkholderiaceae bacterium]